MSYGDTRTESDLRKDVCNHCGVSIYYQPPKETECNHVYYPEACQHCSEIAAYTVKVIQYDISKVSHREE